MEAQIEFRVDLSLRSELGNSSSMLLQPILRLFDDQMCPSSLRVILEIDRKKSAHGPLRSVDLDIRRLNIEKPE